MAECNARLMKEVSEEMKCSTALVKECVEFYGQFIADTIRAGSLEGVAIPYLGKIQVKLINQQYKEFLHAQTPAFRRMLLDAPRTQIDELLKIEE